MNEERLTEIVFEAVCLMMNVMIARVVAVHKLQRVPREGEAAVVVNCLGGGEGEKESSLSHGHASQGFCKSSSEGVEKETLEGMIVQRAVCVGNGEAMVYRMDVFVQKFIDVEEAMEEVLPGVNNEANWGGERC